MAVTYSLLTIVNQVTAELGLPQLTSIVGNSDLTARQILALANRSGDNLYQEHQWTPLQNYSIISIGTPTYIGDAVTVAGSADMVLTTNAGIVANYYAVTGVEVPTSARVIAVNVDGITITMDEPSQYTGTSPVVVVKDTFNIPADFKWFLNRTMWDRTNHWELIGPISPEVDEWQRSGIVSQGPRIRWRQVGLPDQCWRLWPPPSATNSYPLDLVFEYVSDYWCQSSLGVAQPYFQADTDKPIVDGQAIVLEVKWRLWQARGFSYAAFQQEALNYISRLAAKDGGSPDLYLGRRRGWDDFLISPWSVADGGWPTN